MAIGYPSDGDVMSGMKSTCDTFVEIDVEKAMKDGIKFFESKNKVILSAGIDGVIPRVSGSAIWLQKYFKRVTINKDEVFSGEKALSYLLVVDFQANCTKEGEKPLKIQEIIEFPVVVVNVKARKIEDFFHYYLRPQAEAKITAFCTELTGITQATVDKGILLQECIAKFDHFLKEKVYLYE